ncbi:Fc receptor 5 [Solea senegalensis]|uniref:Fc receptor 5 n=1 Tax=Solea senegalensis TaxID=28829 RepID=A0AAV6QRT7_SOLSE|nr:basement membrane-specific heparan sulfate proteoglycan core protein-like isoform X1 [Solea senegalensis]XP_043877260.1 basement membrane-specific heparan sulfate proteoglycan core protein-like isoform X2 [Solea senegalensis]KAG7495801.1 Fc receptor 5 [Solea senegalensis]
MGHTLLRALFLFLLNILLYCGHAEGIELTLEPNSRQFYSGEFLTFKCRLRNGNDNDWQYKFTWNGQQMTSFSPNNSHSLTITPDSGGVYQCTGRNSTKFTKQSNTVTLSVSEHSPTATLTARSTSIPVSGTLNLTCSVDNPPWTYDWYKESPDSSISVIATEESFIVISDEGIYWCRGRRGMPVYVTRSSAMTRIERTLSNNVSVSLEHNVAQIFSGEMVTIRCEIEIQDGGNTEWEYEWRANSSPYTHTNRSEYTLSSASISHTGTYWCKGRKNLYNSTQWSDALTLNVLPYKPRPTLTADKRTIQVSGKVMLTCSLANLDEWQYNWFRRTSRSSAAWTVISNSNGSTSVSEGGIYFCRGKRRQTAFTTDNSDTVTIEKQVPNKVTVTLEPNWPLIFTGENLTIKCVVHGDEMTEWTYEWSKSSSNSVATHDEYRIVSATESNSGNYRCMARHQYNMFSTTEWSDFVTLTVSAETPTASLDADTTAFPRGRSAALTCSVNPWSSGWDYYWYRGDINAEPRITQHNVPSTRQSMSASNEGLYWCRGGRGDPVYYTEYSNPVTIHQSVSKEVALTLQPEWPLIYHGESAILRCEILGNDTRWEYEWMTTSQSQPPNTNELRIHWESEGGFYWCKGRWKSAPQNSTGWSLSVNVAVSYLAPKPVLIVSPSWSSPGDPVTLTCVVEHLSAGWRFYWYKAVPEQLYLDYRFVDVESLEDYMYSNDFEPLPGSSKGTEQNSYIVYGLTHTVGYMCRAGRGDPVYYTKYSNAKFVWFGDFHSPLSLTVTPSRVQHADFSPPASLICKGFDCAGKVWRFHGKSNTLELLNLTNGWTETANEYLCSAQIDSTGVYWCESESGETSNAVNITLVHRDVVLVSPVHPVTEGDSVTLGCLFFEDIDLSCDFLQNGKLIRHDDSWEFGVSKLEISSVSKSDEGFYKCRCSGQESVESWMSVESRHSVPVAVTIGLVCGVMLVVLLPLLRLCWYRKSKNPCGNSQTFATDQTVNQGENQQQVYSSLLHGDVCLYETVGGSGNTGTGCQHNEEEELDCNYVNPDAGPQIQALRQENKKKEA